MSKTKINGIFSLQWAVWLFPLISLGVAAWLTYDYFAHRGPLITLSFADAASVESEKTPLRYRGISVGRVESVKLSEDTKTVVVEARLNRDARDLAVEGSKFWIVQPQVDFGGVRGLDTILNGPYIRVEPGKAGGKFTTQYKGGSAEDVQDSTAGTVAYYLTMKGADSMNPGNPVTYRGLKIGSVTSAHLAEGSQEIVVQINILKRYVKLIRTNSVFWRKVGVHADVGLFGAEVKVNSIESLLKGGIAVATPNEAGAIANAQSSFKLSPEMPKDWENWAPKL